MSSRTADVEESNPSKRNLPPWMSTQGEGEVSKARNESPEDLPVLMFNGHLHYHRTLPDAAAACAEIREMIQEGRIILGFDTEWGPVKNPGAKFPPSVVVQLCADQFNCHVIQLSAMHGFPKELRSLIMDLGILKVGVGVKNDIKKLGKEQMWPEDEVISVNTHSAEELSKLANRVLHTSQHWSLQRLVQHLLKHDLPKDMTIRCGDWTRNPLSEKQLQYAALDAYAGFLLYEKLMSMA